MCATIMALGDIKGFRMSSFVRLLHIVLSFVICHGCLVVFYVGNYLEMKDLLLL